MKSVLFCLFFAFLFAPHFLPQTGEFERGVSLYQQGKFKEAGAIFEQIIEKGNATQEVYEGAIDCALKTNSFTKAISLIEKALKRFGRNYGYELTLGQLFAQSNSLSKAITVLTKMKSAWPDSSEPVHLLSDIYGVTGNQRFQEADYSSAVSAYISALTYNPRNKDVRRNLISAYLALSQLKKAAETAEAGLKLFPKDEDFRQIYLETLIYAEDYEAALKIVQQQAKDNPENLNTQLSLALLYRYTRRADESLRIYAELRAKHPSSKEVYTAEISYLQLAGASDSIIIRYREFLANNPDDTDFMLKLGRQYERKKLYDSSRTIYTELITKDLFRDAPVLIAKTWLAQGATDTAYSILKQYISSGGKSSDGFLELYHLYINKSDLTAAEAHLKLAIERVENNVQFHILLAAIYITQNRLDEAVPVLEPVRDDMKSYPEIPFLTGRIYLLKQDTSRAVFNFIRAVKYAIQNSQLLQAQLATRSSGSNFMNPDSLDVLKETSSALDSVSSILKESFSYLRRILNYQDFISNMSSLILESPNAAILYLQRGRFYHESGMRAEAEQDFATALSLSPNSEEMQYEAGLFYESTEQFTKAYSSYMNAWSLNRKNPLLFRKVIDMAFKADKLEQVCDYWLNIYSLDKENTLLREFLIEVLHAAGRHSDASRVMQQ